MILNNFKINFVIFTLTVHIFLEIQSKTEDNFQNFAIRFKSVKCRSDNKSVITKYCYLKALSRKIVTLNLGLNFLIPHKKPYFVQGILYYRYGTIFRQAVDTKKVEICGIIDGVDTNPLVRLLVNIVKYKAPNLVHKCPYTGDFDLKNFTLNMDLFDRASMLFPEGTYRYDYSSFFNNSITFNLSVTIEIKSPLKESFG